MRWKVVVTISVLSAACADATATISGDEENDSAGVAAPELIPINELASRSYKGHTGGLYLDGTNTVPSWHAEEGRRRAALVKPVDANGTPTVNGKLVMLSFSMSNGTQEFCAASGYTICEAWSFMGKTGADGSVNHSTLTIVNGARGGQVTDRWTSASSTEYDRIRDQGLKPLGLSEQQVQVAWVKMANSTPRRSLPDSAADAYRLHAGLGNVLRALKTRYPNLQMVFLSSRTYAGFATTALNPEPYAYETGFANKWVIEDQIRQTAPGTAPVTPSRAGNLDYRTGGVPWVAWGPYLWAGDQNHRRADGFYYVAADFQSDGTHPSTSGESKVADLLLNFFKSSEFTSCWFLAGQACGGASRNSALQLL
ncbi:MAG: hypothetical protein ACT4O1_18025 [Gemmatimonadota bacterium]